VGERNRPAQKPNQKPLLEDEKNSRGENKERGGFVRKSWGGERGQTAFLGGTSPRQIIGLGREKKKRKRGRGEKGSDPKQHF